MTIEEYLAKHAHPHMRMDKDNNMYVVFFVGDVPDIPYLTFFLYKEVDKVWTCQTQVMRNETIPDHQKANEVWAYVRANGEFPHT